MPASSAFVYNRCTTYCQRTRLRFRAPASRLFAHQTPLSFKCHGESEKQYEGCKAWLCRSGVPLRSNNAVTEPPDGKREFRRTRTTRSSQHADGGQRWAERRQHPLFWPLELQSTTGRHQELLAGRLLQSTLYRNQCRDSARPKRHILCQD